MLEIMIDPYKNVMYMFNTCIYQCDILYKSRYGHIYLPFPPTSYYRNQKTIYLFVALFTVIGIGGLQQVSFHVLLQRFQEVLVIADVYIECGEGLLSLVSVNDQKVTIKHLTYTSKDIFYQISDNPHFFNHSC